MKKSLTIKVACGFLLIGIVLTVSACGAQPSASKIQTAVAGTLANAPARSSGAAQVVEVTQVKEVTKIVEVIVTSTPRPAEKATQTATSQPATATQATPTVEALPASTRAVTDTPQPVVATGPLGLSFNQLMKKYADMTDLQKQDFAATLPGKTVSWTAQVSNITTEGVIILDNPYGSGRVTLQGIPLETAIKIDKGMLVDFTGMIESFEGTFLNQIVIVDAQVKSYYLPPTATPKGNR